MNESVPVPIVRHAHYPAPSLTVFIALQVLDIFTTLLGLEMGAREGSMFLGRLMRAGPLAALLIAKIIAVLLVAMAIRFKRPRVVVFLNYWLAAVVSWNLVVILMSEVSLLRRH
jgi:Na+/alanine symporter